ncbi:MAG: hypothetical protein PHS38_10230 [Bacteroidales bacterium]|nr:hypothetical protein [Bacteroidales bacterium]
MNSEKNIIKDKATILEALKQLNQVTHETQSLFVVDSFGSMVGTLSDGDVRRGIISGGKLEDSICNIMHRDFEFLYKEDFDVKHLKGFRERKIFFIPILDKGKHIVDSVNLLKYKSQLPVDAVLMAGGKGERLCLSLKKVDSQNKSQT